MRVAFGSPIARPVSSAHQEGDACSPPPVRCEKLIRAVFGRKPNTVRKPSKRPGFRPAVEGLEVRDCPAHIYWTGQYGTSFDGQPGHYSWKTGPAPDLWSNPAVLVPANRSPTNDDNIYFDGRVPMTNINCQWGPSATAPKSLNLINGYAGTVQVAPLTVENLYLQSGNIDQSASAEITVTKGMTWTGGVLDSSPTSPSFLTVTGIGTVATILSRDSPPTQPLQIADTITAEGGAELRFGYGTVHFTAAGGIVVENATATVLCDGPTKQLTLTKAAGTYTPFVSIRPGGGYYVSRADAIQVGSHTSELPVEVAGGLLAIDGVIQMTVTGRFWGNGPAVNQTAGETRLATGATLHAAAGFELTGGTFTTRVTLDGATATLFGNMTLNGVQATVRFAQDAPNICGIFEVQGTVTWTRGNYKPTVGSVATGLKSCLWKATGAITIDIIAVVLQPTTFGQIDRGNSWTILESSVSITEDLPDTAGTGYEVDLLNNPVKRWNLRKL